MKAIRILALFCACFALVLAVGCTKDSSSDGASSDDGTGASQPDETTPGDTPSLEGNGNGMGIGEDDDE